MINVIKMIIMWSVNNPALAMFYIFLGAIALMFIITIIRVLFYIIGYLFIYKMFKDWK